MSKLWKKLYYPNTISFFLTFLQINFLLPESGSACGSGWDANVYPGYGSEIKRRRIHITSFKDFFLFYSPTSAVLSALDGGVGAQFDELLEVSPHLPLSGQPGRLGSLQTNNPPPPLLPGHHLVPSNRWAVNFNVLPRDKGGLQLEQENLLQAILFGKILDQLTFVLILESNWALVFCCHYCNAEKNNYATNVKNT